MFSSRVSTSLYPALSSDLLSYRVTTRLCSSTIVVMAETDAPFETLSDDNHGPLITLVSVAFLIVAIIFVSAKLCSVLYFKQRRSAVHTPVWLALVGDERPSSTKSF